ncbi:MAG TPA: fumarylacetoacetate hydrolase family protein [Pyrinomonadaceae bacterium]|nr:fumarylacetoacetate hydrolase family protein [Pyrinomonadaceae bacterium]
MQIITFSTEWADGDSSLRVGSLLNDRYIFDFTRAYEGEPPDTLLRWFDVDGPWFRNGRSRFEQARRNAGEAAERGWLIERPSAYWFPPVPRPGKVICIGLNYRDHAAESKMAIPEKPVVFSKFSTAIIGPGEPVVLPPSSSQVDYEAELAVVIGRRAKNVSADQALDYVLGYTCFNDVSARDFQFADGQWQRGKSCDTFAPMGPMIVTTDDVPDPHKLSIKLVLNGKPMQDSNTDQLIFGVPQLIEFLSQTITLEPGDVIATGTPSGVGFARKPPVFLQEGDEMEVVIESVGSLNSPVIAEKKAAVNVAQPL